MIKNLVNFPYFLKEVVFNMRRNLIMSVASVSTVMILSLILGFFIISVMNLNFLSRRIVSDIQIAVYLEDGLSEAEVKLLQNRIAVIEDVKEVRFISKEEALANIRVKLGTSIEIEDIGTNPLPDSFEVTMIDYNKIENAANLIKENSGVDEVRFGEDITKNLLSLSAAVRVAGVIIVISLIAATVFIVSNTIRITVYARRREISVMQLVGAENWFIRWPFVIEGILYGLIGSILASIILAAAYSAFLPHILQALPFLTLVKPSALIFRTSFMIISTGILVGLSGSWISVNKYLKNFVSRTKYYV